MKINCLAFLFVCVAQLLGHGHSAQAADKPNVLFIVCDDLNDYVEGFGGHPQAVTPNMARLAKSGVRFTQAHCNIPICAPSRASFATGIYPHTSGASKLYIANEGLAIHPLCE